MAIFRATTHAPTHPYLTTTALLKTGIHWWNLRTPDTQKNCRPGQKTGHQDSSLCSHLQYECLRLLSIWIPSLYTQVYRFSETWTMSNRGISETHRPLLHDGWRSFMGSPWPPRLSPALWVLRAGLLSIWVPSLYTRIYLCSETWTMPSWGYSETPQTTAARWLMAVF